jgi:hypothetical protein
MTRSPALLGVFIVLFVLSARAASAQLPTEPVSLGDGRVVVGADVTATIASSDPGFFNYTDYEYSALRNVRVGVTAEFRATSRIQVLGEMRMDHGEQLQPFALFVRFRPWPQRRFDIQAGRIPPTFGAFGRSAYGTANLLIGTPLAYQYLTSLRPDALPASTEELIRMRGRGWLSNFSLGNTAAERGLPFVNSFRWDTGVQAHGVNGIVEWTGSVTTGSLSNPRVDDDNSGRQVAGRAVVRPHASVAIGTSVARGAFLSKTLGPSLDGRPVEDGVQHAFGLDAEYAIGRFLARSEALWSHWRLPVTLAGNDDETLAGTSVLLEGRYRIFPGVQIAARAERLGFERLDAVTGPVSWEAPVRRFEIGGGYSIIRNVIIKGSWQRNLRGGGRVLDDTLWAAQIVYWF